MRKAERSDAGVYMYGWRNNRTSKSKIESAPAALGEVPTHRLRGELWDSRGRDIGTDFDVDLAYDPARDLFYNTNVIEMPVRYSTVIDRLMLFNDQNEYMKVEFTPISLQPSDTFRFEKNAITLALDSELRAQMPELLFVIDEEPTLYD